MRIPSRDIGLHVNYLDLHIALIAQGSSWSPDVADDMIKRMKNLFDNTIHTLVEFGLMGEQEDDDDDVEGMPSFDREVIEPNTVYLMEEDNG
jgi:hypothetical protein